MNYWNREINFAALPAGFSESVIAQNLGSPTSVDVLPDGRVLVASQAGSLNIIKNGSLLPTPFLKLTVDSNGERGLIGVTNDPNFAMNHFIYVYHTVPAAGSVAAFNEVSRFTAKGDVAQAHSEVDILKLNDLSDATNHNGGSMHFGTDGMLYIGVGENRNPDNSQRLTTLLGKVLRIDVSHTVSGDSINDVAKLVPSDNPFVGTATGINGAIYALGFRNPFTFAVQPVTGKIFIDDVGENTWEEIDQLVAGGNYGWHKSEGFAPTVPPAGLGPGTYQDPQLAYNHNGGTPPVAAARSSAERSTTRLRARPTPFHLFTMADIFMPISAANGYANLTRPIRARWRIPIPHRVSIRRPTATPQT